MKVLTREREGAMVKSSMLMSLPSKKDRKKGRKREGEVVGRAGSGNVGKDTLPKLSVMQRGMVF